MKISTSKILALGGLCTLLVSTTNAAFAQGYRHQDQNNRYSQSHQNQWHGNHEQNNREWQNRQNHPFYNHYQKSNNHFGWGQKKQYGHGNWNRHQYIHPTPGQFRYQHNQHNNQYHQYRQARNHQDGS